MDKKLERYHEYCSRIEDCYLKQYFIYHSFYPKDKDCKYIKELQLKICKKHPNYPNLLADYNKIK